LSLLIGTVLLAVAVTLLAGLFPAWRATQINPALQLKGS
jgi:putative ABC transport system permease protein